MASRARLDLIVHINPEGVARASTRSPRLGAAHRHHEDRGAQAGARPHGFDAAFGGARRDEEKSRAKERIFSFRTPSTAGTRRTSGPSCGTSTTPRKRKGESIRVFPLSNWTELDVWQYIHQEGIPIVPLYFAAERPVVERDGTLIMVDDERMPLSPARRPRCAGALPHARLLPADRRDRVRRRHAARDHPGDAARHHSERQGRVIDHDQSGLDGEEEAGGLLLMLPRA
jgi:sulfate adenylyltransferase subunit 2